MAIDSNIQTLRDEIDWLTQVIDQAICSYLKHDGHEKSWEDIPRTNLELNDSPYANKIKEWELDIYGRLALVLAFTPHLSPESLDVFFGKNQIIDKSFTEFGGISDSSFSGFLPTGQTLLFLIASTQPFLQSKVFELFDSDGILMKEQVLHLKHVEDHLPRWSGVLSISSSWIHFFIYGEKKTPKLSSSFPAQKINTQLNWNDLILEDHVMDQITEIKTWIEHQDTLMNDWGLEKKIKPGYRTLFFGPPGTGKTLTASLLGKETGKDVFRIDLSMVVSKYIGETEKNLSRVFDTAQYKDWILFFDEADSLFSQRTPTSSSNDRHANHQTGYLLQRIEDFPGIVILASNLKSNIDEAFTRRFQSMIHFDIPSVEQRFQLWQNAFSGTCTLENDIDLWKLAEEYELAGGAIINVLRYCALSAIKRNTNEVKKSELFEGLRREFKKENKTLAFIGL